MSTLSKLHESFEKALWYTLTRKLSSFLLLFVFDLIFLAVYNMQREATVGILKAGAVDRSIIQAISDKLDGGLYVLLVITFIALAWNVGQILYLRWLVVRPLKVITGILNDIARGEGDFTRSLPLLTHDELRDLADSYNRFTDKMRTMITDVKSGAQELQQTADGLASISARVADNSQQQSQETYAMAAQVEIMTYTLDGLASQAEDVQRISSESNEHSIRGGEVIHAAVNEMNQIAQMVNESSLIIQNLGQKSDQISQIVNVIKEIADQTNLLALNAAIEAARAGEHGRGFAVVADEVRKLSERTSKSTQEISSMIENIQSGTRLAIQSMEGGVKRVGEGALLAQQAGEAINQIKVGVGQVVLGVNEISQSLKENALSNSENSRKVESIARISEENSNAFMETSKTIQRVDDLANNLGNLVGRFRT
ncbi:MAG: methyl-accepting chemotaxis protein [Sulfuricellaceae bacterium]